MPAVYSTKKKLYGPKEIDGNIYEDQPIGEEDSIDISLSYNDNVSAQIIENALRSSPPSAILSHLQRLAMHKRFGSSDNDRTVLLHDYAEALRNYSDFTVYTACRALWETDPSPFFPKIKILGDLCAIIQDSFNNLSRGGTKMITSAPAALDRANFYQSPKDNPLRRVVCDFLISKGKKDYFNDLTESNYNLEMLARHNGYQVKEENRDEQNAKVSAMVSDILKNMKAG